MNEKLKLLIHVAAKEKWDMAVRNGLNFLKTGKGDEELRVILIANGDSVTRCTKCDRALFDNLKQFVLDGGEIYICENSLKDFGIPTSRLPEIFSTIPAAIRALVDYQRDGWIYVRP